MSLTTENNRQYYEGAQGFRGNGVLVDFTTTFNTDLIFGSASPSDVDYQKNNFKLYTSTTGVPGSWSETTTGYSVSGNVITFVAPPAIGLYIVVQLKKLDGGNYGTTTADKAYGDTVEENYGSYAYTKLNDVVNNFLVAYVGAGKLIPSVKRTDVLFHAKRAMQEFSYDTLKSVNSQELTIPHSLSVVLPQDFVNYVNLYWVDSQGAQHIIMPANNLTSNPSELPLQGSNGVPVQDNFNKNIETTSIIEERWQTNFLKNEDQELLDSAMYGWEYYYGWPEFGYGQLYGLDPQYSNGNGYFTINNREGKISFSSNLVDKVIIFEYISDGLSTNLETRVPKLAEEAMYQHLLYSIMSTRRDTVNIAPQYKRQRYAALRNAKIRLSNIKLDEIVQVMRNKSKWIKH